MLKNDIGRYWGSCDIHFFYHIFKFQESIFHLFYSAVQVPAESLNFSLLNSPHLGFLCLFYFHFQFLNVLFTFSTVCCVFKDFSEGFLHFLLKSLYYILTSSFKVFFLMARLCCNMQSLECWGCRALMETYFPDCYLLCFYTGF